MDHRSRAAEAVPDDTTVGDRADHGGERGGEHIEADDLAPLGTEDTHDCLTEVSGRAGHEDLPPVHELTISTRRA
jgi:hypothetical protein